MRFVAYLIDTPNILFKQTSQSTYSNVSTSVELHRGCESSFFAAFPYFPAMLATRNIKWQRKPRAINGSVLFSNLATTQKHSSSPADSDHSKDCRYQSYYSEIIAAELYLYHLCQMDVWMRP